MARSYRKTPVHGVTTARSEKDDKRLLHGMARTAERIALSHVRDDEDVVVRDEPNLLMNPWSMAKDGRVRWKRSDKPKRDRRGGFTGTPEAGDQPHRKSHRFWGK